MKKIKYVLPLVVVLILFPVINCFAADIVCYEIQWVYNITNISDEDITRLPFTFENAPFAVDSPYQPDTDVTQNITTIPAKPSAVFGILDHYKTDLPAGETQAVTITWKFNSGNFDQRLFNQASQETIPSVKPFFGNKELIELTKGIISGIEGTRNKALAIYTWITQNLKYDEIQSYAKPEKTTCETFANLFNEMCSIAEIPSRKVIGYVINFPDVYGATVYRTVDITDSYMHAWNEFYDEMSGWVMVDATFDEGKSEFDYFMRGYKEKPHLALFYDKLPTIQRQPLYKHYDQIEWSRKKTLTRIRYEDSEPQEENVLTAFKRIKAENKAVDQFLKEEEVSIEINRVTDMLSITKNILNIPPEYQIKVNDLGLIEISNAGKQIVQMQFKGNSS